MGFTPTIAVVTRPTRLQALRERYVTRGQAKFYLAQAKAIERHRTGEDEAEQQDDSVAAEADFSHYEREDDTYQSVVDRLERELDFGMPIKLLDRSFVPQFDFWSCAAVVVVGQDGLVANTAKYVGELPIIAVNPDPQRIDGVLLPFRPDQARRAVDRVLNHNFKHRPVTLAEVSLNDGQKMLAFNDFYIGASSHVSARYTLTVADESEPQSSSGVLVSTGAGSTGWMSSVFNMAGGVSRLAGHAVEGQLQLSWEDRRLIWAVREPFASRHSQANLIAGVLDEGAQLTLESLMPEGGVIFSDGIENDFLTFNSGTIAHISAARQTARLVVE